MGGPAPEVDGFVIAAGDPFADEQRTISKIIKDISEISTSISSAVEEQGAATQEVAKNITGVSEASAEAGRLVNDVQAASDQLSEMASRLQQQMDTYVASVRA